MAQGKSREAARSLSNAASLLERNASRGSLDPGLLPILDELNKAFKAIQGDSGTGIEALYRQALTIRETLYGPDSSELISTVEGPRRYLCSRRRSFPPPSRSTRGCCPCARRQLGKSIQWWQ